ncbi:MAG: hypothetical protein PHX18_02730 [Candidatus Gastranaerophilales bacterium]|nr:hypothetical protein [Candidatus Gastranaerophilales bacterium]
MIINSVSNVKFQGIQKERDFFQNRETIGFDSLMDDIIRVSKMPESIAADKMNAIAIKVKNAQNLGIEIDNPELLVTSAILNLKDIRSKYNQEQYLEEVARLAQYSGCLEDTSNMIMSVARKLGVANKVGPTIEKFNPTSYNIVGLREDRSPSSGKLSQRACLTK